MERSRVASHHLGSTRPVPLVENLVQDRLLLEPIDVVWRLWSDEQVLLAD